MKLIATFLIFTTLAIAQISLDGMSKEQKEYYDKLNPTSKQYYKQYLESERKVDSLIEATGLKKSGLNEETGNFRMVDVDFNGQPVYVISTNADAAVGTNASLVHPGSGNYDLTGSSNTFGIWEVGGHPRVTHRELADKVYIRDGNYEAANHATHVAGTMIASGLWDLSKGMSYEASLSAWDTNNDGAEMNQAASDGLLISQHSYASVCGWRYDSDDQEWYWFGWEPYSETESWQFGFYSGRSASWDRIAFDNPYYLIVKSAANDRGSQPSSQPQSHLVWDGNAWVTSTTVRDPDGGSDGYDCLTHDGSTSKNVLVVGAVEKMQQWTQASDVVMSSFSSWGPTDDGRIKPDICGIGVGLISSGANADDHYYISSGTSMSGPNVSGSAGLIIHHYQNLYGQDKKMKSATLKGLIIHTANEAGDHPGPDYSFGWGLMDTKACADLIQENFDNGNDLYIEETELIENNTNVHSVYSSGNEPLKITINWTDPEGTPVQSQLNPRDKMLVNDLDLWLEKGSTTFYPWNLDFENPSNAAYQTERNELDNVEQVFIDNPEEGVYLVHVGHFGSLQNGSQSYTILRSGIDQTLPDLTVSQQSLDFDEVELDSIKSILVENLIRNDGNADLVIDEINFSNNNFFLSESINLPITLNPGSTLSLSIGFSPDNSQSYMEELSFVSNDANSDIVELQGTGGIASFSANQNELNFGDVVVDNQIIRNLIITNDGTFDLEIDEFTLAGSEFEFLDNLPISLPSNESHTLQISFESPFIGEYTETLTLTNNKFDKAINVELTANSGVASIVSNEQILDFNTVPINSTKNAQIEITNDGDFDLEVDEYNIDLQEFSLLTQLPVEISAGNSEIFEISFNSSESGSFTSTLTLTNSEYSINEQIELKAEALDVSFEILNQSIDFGDVFLDSTVVRSIEIGNSSPMEITIDESTIDLPEFELLTQLPISIEPGNSKSIDISFRSNQIGNYNGIITLKNNQFNFESSIDLFANAGTVSFESEKEIVDFGEVLLDSTRTDEFEITNTGSFDIQISGFEIASPDFELVTELPILIESGNTEAFVVSFTAFDIGINNSSITLIDNNYLKSHTIDLTAKSGNFNILAEDSLIINYNWDDKNIDFIESTFLFNNAGNLSYSIDEVLFEGDRADKFELVNSLPILVDGEASAELLIRYNIDELDDDYIEQFLTKMFFNNEKYNINYEFNIQTQMITSVDLENPLINIYPNPNTGNFNIELDKMYNNINLIINNGLGEIVYQSNYNSVNNLELQLDLPNGIYYLELKSNNDIISNNKILIQK